jgi:cytosine/adenosine deaminase-related metal-dependent hydrolase
MGKQSHRAGSLLRTCNRPCTKITHLEWIWVQTGFLNQIYEQLLELAVKMLSLQGRVPQLSSAPPFPGRDAADIALHPAYVHLHVAENRMDVQWVHRRTLRNYLCNRPL